MARLFASLGQGSPVQTSFVWKHARPTKTVQVYWAFSWRHDKTVGLVVKRTTLWTLGLVAKVRSAGDEGCRDVDLQLSEVDNLLNPKPLQLHPWFQTLIQRTTSPEGNSIHSCLGVFIEEWFNGFYESQHRCSCILHLSVIPT